MYKRNKYDYQFLLRCVEAILNTNPRQYQHQPFHPYTPIWAKPTISSAANIFYCICSEKRVVLLIIYRKKIQSTLKNEPDTELTGTKINYY